MEPRAAARQRVLRRYAVGTQSAEVLLDFVRDHLRPVKGSRGGLYLHKVGERLFHLRASYDAKGRVGFAAYAKKTATLAVRVSFRRDKKKFPRPSKRGFSFFPLPLVWAQLQGVDALRLGPEPFALWRRELERAAADILESVEEFSYDERAARLGMCQ